VPKGVTPADGTVKPCYRRASVRILLAMCLFGCQENGAAVNVRWWIVDLTRGNLVKPNDPGISQPDGSCAGDAPPLAAWRIEKVRLVLANPVTGDEARPDLLFNCNQREAITPFSLPVDTFALSLRAVNGGLDDSGVVTPAPSVRQLKAREVVNLDVVALGIHPVPLAAFDGGVVDLSAPDSGPVM
jgi:hypothetical protein